MRREPLSTDTNLFCKTLTGTRFVSGKEKRNREQEQIERTYGLSVRSTLKRVIYL